MFNSAQKNDVLIVSSYFSNIGGTEIESVGAALFFSRSGKFDKVTIFSHEKINIELDKLLKERENIVVKSFPDFYYSRAVKLIDDVFLKMGVSNRISRLFYVKYLTFQYSSFFIVSYPNNVVSNLFALLVPKRKRVIYKITMNYELDFNSDTIKALKNVDKILVFNGSQKKTLSTKYQFKNVEVCDIPILLEQKLLEILPATFSDQILKFGYLGRIAVEKNIGDMIKLMEYLHDNNVSVSLHINGDGEENYKDEIKSLIAKSSVSQYIYFRDFQISPHDIDKLYESIDIFLVTSIHEGGPITALEALASGRMIFSYKVGSMEERLKDFDYVLSDDFYQLCDNVDRFANLSMSAKADFVHKLRNYYLSNLSNEKKQTKLINLLH